MSGDGPMKRFFKKPSVQDGFRLLVLALTNIVWISAMYFVLSP